MKDIRVVYQNNKPEGIRDKGGFLFFFSTIQKWPRQEERYRQEVQEQFELADYLKEKLDTFEYKTGGLNGKTW